MPDSNRSYWVPKLQRTRERDAKNRRKLEEMGWNVEVVWACQITPERLASLADSIRANEPQE